MALDLFGFAQSVKEQTIGGAPKLNIVSGPAALETLVRPAISAFRKHYPKTKIVAQTLPPEHAVEELVQRRAHILVYHSNTVSGLPHVKRLKVTKLAAEPYDIVFRPDHPVSKTDMSLSAITKFDWAIAGYDSIFESNLSPEVRDILTQNDFPRYRLLSQSACVDLVIQSDILTTIPRSEAERYVSQGTLTAAPHPAELSFEVSAATLVNAHAEPTMEKFIACMKAID
jgi:DNA-binding transcriptional LysR family regulator